MPLVPPLQYHCKYHNTHLTQVQGKSFHVSDQDRNAHCPGCCNVNRLSLKDRPYEPEYKSGRGYKIVRKVLLPVEDDASNAEQLLFDGFLDDKPIVFPTAINIIKPE